MDEDGQHDPAAIGAMLDTALANPEIEWSSDDEEELVRFCFGNAVQDLDADKASSFAVVGPSFWGDGMYPPSDAVYYPLYTKCAELELPLCINTGIPGPPIPGEVQNPIHLDRVCVRFPELKLCMIHGADPWWDIAIRLMIKYKNLRLMTSAWSPKRLPDSLLHYMRTRGQDKVIYASDWPVLKMRRVVPEARALDLPADVLENYLYNNADTFLFGATEEH